MARQKAGMTTKVTISLPNSLLELADFQAERLALHRYDVVRMGLAQGLMLMEVQAQLAQGKLQELGKEMFEAMQGLKDPDVVAEKLGEAVVANAQAEAEELGRKSKKVSQ